MAVESGLYANVLERRAAEVRRIFLTRARMLGTAEPRSTEYARPSERHSRALRWTVNAKDTGVLRPAIRGRPKPKPRS